MEIKIIQNIDENNPFLIIYKPSGLPSAPLSIEDKNNAFSLAAEKFPQLLEIKGKKEIEHGLVHRIDTMTSGLLMIAANQEFYDYIQKEQAEGKFYKSYKALCKLNIQNIETLGGFPEFDLNKHNELLKNKKVTIESYFRNYGEKQKEVRPVFENSSKIILSKVGKKKLYKTEINFLNQNEEIYEFQCKISEGYRHQVRCHLAYLGFPIIGDPVYNSMKNNKKMEFSAIGLEFIYKNKTHIITI